MARANLVVETELLNAFMSASSSHVRWLQATLDDVNICLASQGNGTDSVEDDLTSMKRQVLKNDPCFVLFKVGAGSGNGGAWVLIAYVPETSKVRARMLYASGQEDVKQALGHTNFLGSVHVSEPGDVDLDSLMSSRKRDLTDAPLTEEEIYAKEEIAYMASPTEAKANAMGLVPFEFSDAVEKQFREFISESRNLVEFLLENGEKVVLGSSTSEDTLSSTNIFKGGPRFYLLRSKSSERTYFVFSCPTESKIKDRMVYSTAKATVSHHLSEMGLDVSKIIELADPQDIDEMIDLHETPDEDAGKIVFKEISKPARRGRGKARIVKST